MIWKRIPLPAWRNRPVPRLVSRDHRLMLLLAIVCGVSVLAGFPFQHARLDSTIAAIFFVIAYLTGGWFAAQDVWSGLKQRKIDIQFLMIAVALGALSVTHGLRRNTSLSFPRSATRSNSSRIIGHASQSDRFSNRSQESVATLRCKLD